MNSEAIRLLQQSGYSYVRRKPAAQPALGSGNQTETGAEETQSQFLKKSDRSADNTDYALQKTDTPATTTTRSQSQSPPPVVAIFDPESGENNSVDITGRQSATIAAAGKGRTGMYNGYAERKRMLSYSRQQSGGLVNILA